MMAAQKVHSGALQPAKLLDVLRMLAGPWAAQTLGDLRAQVIKVERPSVGDDARAWGPPYVTDTQQQPTGESAYYMCTNRNKLEKHAVPCGQINTVRDEFANPQLQARGMQINMPHRQAALCLFWPIPSACQPPQFPTVTPPRSWGRIPMPYSAVTWA